MWESSWNTDAEGGQSVGLAMKSLAGVGSGENPYGYSFASDSSPKRFDALFTGTSDIGVHTLFGKYAHFWTYSADGTTNAWAYQLERVNYQFTNPEGSVSHYSIYRDIIYSVQCK